MRKTEMFEILLAKVCELCDVRSSDVLNYCKIQSVVDARLLLVQYLRRIGLSNDDIALIFIRAAKGKDYYPGIDEWKRKAKGIDKMFNSYSSRCLQSYAFCIISKDIKEFCHNQYRDMYVVGMKKLPQ